MTWATKTKNNNHGHKARVGQLPHLGRMWGTWKNVLKDALWQWGNSSAVGRQR